MSSGIQFSGKILTKKLCPKVSSQPRIMFHPHYNKESSKEYHDTYLHHGIHPGDTGHNKSLVFFEV